MKLSELMELALTDLEKCEDDPRYEIYMDQWHEPSGEKCHVCLAGAVMAQTCGADSYQRVFDWSFDRKWELQFQALDSVRRGEIGIALYKLTGKYAEWCEPITSYHYDPVLFKSDVRRVVDQLKEKGL